jgi:hypothetical protein
MPGSNATPAHWYRTRLTRRPYALWSPLPVDWASARLVNNLTPRSTWGTKCFGAVSGPSVWIAAVGSPLMRSPLRFRFEGAIYGSDDGSWLTGSIGPLRLVCGFLTVWLAGAGLMFLVGISALASSIASGRTGPLPLFWVSSGLLLGGVLLTELTFRIARDDWRIGEAWLQQLLQVPQDRWPPPDQ